ncbi:MAG: helix-turn-helix transcriptional regulator [Candidatus Hodarchaeales archaeon]
MLKKGFSKQIWLLIITFLVLIPLSTYTFSATTKKNLDTKNISSQTLFEIKIARLDFYIQSGGKYNIEFLLLCEGNENTSLGNATGEFTISEDHITYFDLVLIDFDSPVNSSFSFDETSSIFSFIINQEIAIGREFRLWGKLKGSIQEDMTDIYSFHLGIDWGTSVGSQITRVIVDETQKIIGYPNPLPDETKPPLEYSWTREQITEFNVSLKVISKFPEIHLLVTDISSWLPILGEQIILKVHNTGPLVTQVYINTPIWIDHNVTFFSLAPNQKLNILFLINSNATEGINGTIDIISMDLLEVLKIPVFVQKSDPSTPNMNLLELPFLIFSFFVILITTGFVYSKRKTVSSYYQNRKIHTSPENNPEAPLSNDNWRKSNGEFIQEKPESSPLLDTLSSVDIINDTTTEISWNYVRSRWDKFLSERELKVIEILFNEGSLSQQKIADQMNLSKSTISRIISRLELKNLLHRERSGMSNRIKLNKERIL